MSGVPILRISAPIMTIKAYKGVFISCLGLTITHVTARCPTSAPPRLSSFYTYRYLNFLAAVSDKDGCVWKTPGFKMSED